MTHSHVWHDSSMCEAWLITTGLLLPGKIDMPFDVVGQVVHVICVTWLIHMWHVSFICETWLIAKGLSLWGKIHLAFDVVGQVVHVNILQCVAVCCSVVQCVAVCFRVLQTCSPTLWGRRHTSHMWHDSFTCETSVYFNMLQRVAVCCSVLQCVAACCSVLQCVAAMPFDVVGQALHLMRVTWLLHVCDIYTRQYVAMCRSVLQCVAAFCSVLQSVADMPFDIVGQAACHTYEVNAKYVHCMPSVWEVCTLSIYAYRGADTQKYVRSMYTLSVCRDPFMCETWLIHVWDMTYYERTLVSRILDLPFDVVGRRRLTRVPYRLDAVCCVLQCVAVCSRVTWLITSTLVPYRCDAAWCVLQRAFVCFSVLQCAHTYNDSFIQLSFRISVMHRVVCCSELTHDISPSLNSRFVSSRHVTHMNTSCHTYEYVMSHIWIRHVTHMNTSRSLNSRFAFICVTWQRDALLTCTGGDPYVIYLCDMTHIWDSSVTWFICGIHTWFICDMTHK